MQYMNTVPFGGMMMRDRQQTPLPITPPEEGFYLGDEDAERYPIQRVSKTTSTLLQVAIIYWLPTVLWLAYDKITATKRPNKKSLSRAQ